MKRRSISFKLGVISSIITFVFIIIFALFAINLSRNRLIAQLKDKGISLLMSLSEVSTSRVLTQDYLFLSNLPRFISEEEDVLYLILLDNEGRAIVHTDENFQDLVLKDRITKQALQSSVGKPFIQEFHHKNLKIKVYDISTGIGLADKRYATLRIGISTKRLNSIIYNMYKLSISGGILISFIAFIICFSLSKISIRPIFILKRAIDTLVQRKSVDEIRITTGDEVEEITNSFNKMLKIWKERTEELNTLFNLSTEIVSTLSIDKVLNKIMKASLEMLNAETGSLMLIDEKTKKLYIKANSGLDEEIVRNTVLKVGERIAGWVVENKEPLLIIDGLKNDPRFSHLEEREEIKSSLCVPLEIKDKIIGVLNVNNLSSETNFTEKDLKLLLTFANQATLAIENAHLYEKETEQRRELEKKIEELERFNKLAVGRELRMIELKEEVNSLLEKLGQPKKYEAPEKIKEAKKR